MRQLVVLTLDQVAVDDEDARRHVDRAIAHGWKTYRDDTDRYAANVASYRAERAFAVWRGLPDWKRDDLGFKKPDVDGFFVRLGLRAHYGLVIHDADPPGAVFALVTAADDSMLRFFVCGWLPIEVGQAMREEGIGRAVDGPYPGWIIPQSHLRAIEELSIGREPYSLR